MRRGGSNGGKYTEETEKALSMGRLATNSNTTGERKKKTQGSKSSTLNVKENQKREEAKDITIIASSIILKRKERDRSKAKQKMGGKRKLGEKR